MANVFDQFDEKPQVSGANVFDQFDQTPTTNERRFVDKTAENMVERFKKTKGYAESIGRGSPVRTVYELPRIGAVATGQAAGAVGDIIGEGITRAYKSAVPPEQQRRISAGLKSVMQSPVGRTGMLAMQKGREAYGQFKESYPDAAIELESALNLAGFGAAKPVVKGAARKTAAGVKEATDIATDVARMAKGKVSPHALEGELSFIVEKNMFNAWRPSVVGKSNFAQAKKAFGRSKDAVKAIINNKRSLKFTDEGVLKEGALPENLWQFSEAIDQTKKDLFGQYDSLSKTTGDVAVNLDKPIKELYTVANDKVTRLANPGAAKYAKELADRFRNSPPLNASEMQDVIAKFNDNLASFYKNPSYEANSNAAIDAILVNNLRKQLDDMIGRATGAEYQALKKQYGSLKSIEKEVVNRAIVSSRGNKKGLIDFTDIFSGSQAIGAMTTASPAMFAQAATAKGIASFWKNLNDPNRYVKKMFKDSEKVVDLMGDFTPKSKAGQRIMTDLARLEQAKQAAKRASSKPLEGY